MRLLVRLNDIVATVLKWTVVAMVALMTSALAAQVLLRYAFNVTLSWSEELSLGLFTWTVLLMAGLGVREGSHVRMALLMESLRGPVRREAERAIHVATMALGGFLVFAGWRYVADTRGSTSAAIGYPIEFLYSSAVVCGALIFLFALEHALAGQVPESDLPAAEPPSSAGPA